MMSETTKLTRREGLLLQPIHPQDKSRELQRKLYRIFQPHILRLA